MASFVRPVYSVFLYKTWRCLLNIFLLESQKSQVGAALSTARREGPLSARPSDIPSASSWEKLPTSLDWLGSKLITDEKPLCHVLWCVNYRQPRNESKEKVVSTVGSHLHCEKISAHYKEVGGWWALCGSTKKLPALGLWSRKRFKLRPGADF